MVSGFSSFAISTPEVITDCSVSSMKCLYIEPFYSSSSIVLLWNSDRVHSLPPDVAKLFLGVSNEIGVKTSYFVNLTSPHVYTQVFKLQEKRDS